MPPSNPSTVWKQMTDPDDTARERAIRADQRRLDLRELRATAKDLEWLIDRICPDDQIVEGGKACIPLDTLDNIRRHARHLVTRTRQQANRLEDAA